MDTELNDRGISTMAFHVPKEPFNAYSFRECSFYINYLNQALNQDTFQSVEGFSSVQECLNALRQELSYLEKNGKINSNHIKKMKTDFQNCQLSGEDFLWLHNSDERFCNWVWCYLREQSKIFDRIKFRDQLRRGNSNKIKLHDFGLDLDIGRNFDGLSHDAFKPMSNNFTARKSNIIDSFRSSELELSQQRKVIQTLLNTWESILEDTRMSAWLEENQTAQSNWSWKYIKDTGYRLQSEVWSVSSEQDKRAAIVVIFDMLHDKPDRKSLLIGKMKRAWSQKKFRDKCNGKRPYSVSMTDRTKKRLMWLVEQEDSSINEIIKNLIDMRFEQLK
ncbi:hypothetical protein [Vibrio kanaloae]|uniref:Uncharacterized protein n=1 Tax=Vibrio kanaloae TaxID=170673 RepID=A0A4U1YV91_9VIBR|nr:hypothetical protein [Vibrio kanaloae]TKF25364.1 hypothetical protein FCV52_12200 [Vibrio kanaloae]